jgi:hypothetical protein
MSRNAKILLGVVLGAAVFLFLCAGTALLSAGGYAFNRVTEAMEFDAAQVRSEAAAIAEFDAPAGYEPAYAFAMGGFNLVSYDPGDGRSHMLLAQGPEWLNLDPAAFEAQIRRDLGRRDLGGRRGWEERPESTIVDHRTLRVDGQPVEFVIGEGVNGDGHEYRTMAGVWNSARGQVLIYIEEPVTRWNQAEIDAFVASIH